MPVIDSFTAFPTGVTSANNSSLLNWSVSGYAAWSSGRPGFYYSQSLTLTASVVLTGGAMLPGTYSYQVYDTYPEYSNEVTVTITGNTSYVQLSWTGGSSTVDLYKGVFGAGTEDRFIHVTGGSLNDYGPSLELDDGSGSRLDLILNSSLLVSPTATTTYTLIARDTSNATVTATATVTVSDTTAPTISISASNTSITAGQSVILTLDWTYAAVNFPTVDHSVGSVFSYFHATARVTPYSTSTYTATNTNAVGTVTASVTITVTGTAPGIFESFHPYENTVYSFQVPSWPGGLNTVYLTFSQETFVDPTGGTFTLSTDQTSVTVTDIGWAGYTLAIASSDGVLEVNTYNGQGKDEFYGFKVLSISLTAPASNGYLLGNPNAVDYVSGWYYNWNTPPDPPYTLSNGLEGPNYVYADVTAARLRLMPAQLNSVNTAAPYEYQFRFPNATGIVAWSVSSGSLPAGLTLDTTTGIISGTATGNSGIFTITATDGTYTARGDFSIDVYPQPVWVGQPSPNVYGSEEFEETGLALDYGFHRNGSRWCMLPFRPAGDAQSWPTMFQSGDDGITWTEVGVATRPTFPSGMLRCRSTMYNPGSGNVVYALAVAWGSGLGSFYLLSFDLTTLAWTQVASVAYVNAFIAGFGPIPFTLAVLSTGVWRICWYGRTSSGGDVGTWMVEYTPGVGFSLPIQLWSSATFNAVNPDTGLTVTPKTSINSVGLQSNDVSHVTMFVNYNNQNMTNQLNYFQIDSSGVVYQSLISSVINNASTGVATTPTGFPVMNKFNASTMGLGNWTEMSSLNQMILSTWAYRHPSDGSADIGPAVIRVTLTSPPTLVCEKAGVIWDSNTQSYDDTVWGGAGQTMGFIGGCGLDSARQLTIFWTNVGYLETSRSNFTNDGIYYSVNSVTSPGNTAQGWSKPVEYWSGNWSPFDNILTGNSGFGETAPLMSVESVNSQWYVHYDAYTVTSPGEVNMTFPPANPLAVSTMLKNYTSGPGGAMGGPAGVLGNYAMGLFFLLAISKEIVSRREWLSSFCTAKLLS